MTDTMRVTIHQDVETGDYHYERVGDGYEGDYTFDVNAERFNEWERVRLSWERIGEALAVMYNARRNKLEAQRNVDHLRAEYEAARARFIEATGETP